MRENKHRSVAVFLVLVVAIVATWYFSSIFASFITQQKTGFSIADAWHQWSAFSFQTQLCVTTTDTQEIFVKT